MKFYKGFIHVMCALLKLVFSCELPSLIHNMLRQCSVCQTKVQSLVPPMSLCTVQC